MRRLSWALLLIAVGACDCGDGDLGAECATSDECEGELRCIDGTCQPFGGGDAGPMRDGGPCVSACGTTCCIEGEVCVADTACAPRGPACTSDEECSDDSWCDEAAGHCIPWDTPPGMTRDPDCTRLIVAGTFAPSVQCEFREAPAGDAFPLHLHVLSTPMVVDFNIGRGPDDPPRPSIVAVFDDGEDGDTELPTGVIRVLDGETCAQQAELGSLSLVSHSSPPAVGDLDGDGRAEIVANQAGGGVVAFRYVEASASWEVLWRSTRADGTPYLVTGGGWAGPSIYDLDDDGSPEVLRGGVVLSASGVLLDESLGVLATGADPLPAIGMFGVVADVDGDGRAEQVQGHGVWEWDEAAGTWVAEAWSPGGSAPGHVAIADFGAFPGGMGWAETAPEVVVITPGSARVQTLDGVTVFGPIAIPGGGSGGPPTVADFDGDGRPELATAGALQYVVFDLDCNGAPLGECASGRTDGIAWLRPSQDESSNVTGSSVFDFEGDGRAEAVYGDECFVRVYDGETGTVIFSQYRSSCTWYENPVVADVDGDFNAEIVIGNNFNCGDASSGIACRNLEPGAIDPLFAGIRCSDGSDCLSGACDSGFCRCTMDSECCAGDGCALAGFVCAAPPAGTPGAGNTCRASHPAGALGIRVYRDTADRWVSSRRIWNQHAYHVTNVNDDGTIPRTSAAMQNWTTEGLNNFRQNVQGTAIPGATPDATARGIAIECAGDTVSLEAMVCNRGTEPMGAGLGAGFYLGDPDMGGTLICRGFTERVLEPGACLPVSCTGTATPDGMTIVVVADDENAQGECKEGNNRASLGDVMCLR